MTTWSEFETASPALAAAGWGILRRSGSASNDGDGLLATVRGDLAPRIHPISVAIVEGHLYAFILQSAKLRDLEQDGRYALHAILDPAAPDEFMIRGRAQRVDGPARDAAIKLWAFTPDETYVLFELHVESAVVGRRGPDDWPPRYETWTA
jgi:hypothetical protein